MSGARLLLMQRKGRYVGEYAPEVMAVVDELTLDENPGWWDDEVERQKQVVGRDAEAWGFLDIEIPDDAIRAALFPSIDRVPVKATPAP